MNADSITISAQLWPVEATAGIVRPLCLKEDAPGAGTEAYVTGRPAYVEGVAPAPRPVVPGYDSAVTVILLGLFLFVAINFKHYSTFLKTFAQELLSVRRRANAFDDHTVSETRILMSMVLTACVSEALLLFAVMYVPGMSPGVFPLLAAMLGLTVGYYMVQLVAYSTVGSVFTDSIGAVQWVKGFNASQALLGIALVVPALVSFFYPSTAPRMVALGAGLYVAARIIFICKGFKIFYHNIFSLVYFILYLCALEIAPLALAYRMRVLFY